jgi:hypothetical protein
VPEKKKGLKKMGEVGCCVTALVCCVDVHSAGVGRLGQLGLAGLFFFFPSFILLWYLLNNSI